MPLLANHCFCLIFLCSCILSSRVQHWLDYHFYLLICDQELLLRTQLIKYLNFESWNFYIVFPHYHSINTNWILNFKITARVIVMQRIGFGKWVNPRGWSWKGGSVTYEAVTLMSFNYFLHAFSCLAMYSKTLCTLHC